MADRIKLAEEWLLRPENNIGQELKHREYLKGEPLCGNGIISPECEVCRLSLMLSAYRLYSPLVGDGDPALVDDQLEAATRFLATLKELDPPGFVDNLRAVLVLRDSDDPEALRLAGKAITRNLQRLEDELDNARDLVEHMRRKEENVT